MYRENSMRERSVSAARRDDERGSFLIVMFYTLPGEGRPAMSDMLDRMIRETLENRHALYGITCREPWFEPALLPANTPMIGHLGEATRSVLGREPEVVTISKQDSFVLINHARIPTVSFGCRGRLSGRGSFHSPDEYLLVDELWTGARIAHRAVRNWLDV
jgi:acetylornithine deacetylase/succinyl-diaminopimelate desuccinylase-like protein